MIVIPMAGFNERFTRAGYSQPKYRLQAFGKSLFAHAVSSFSAYFKTEPFLFILRNVDGSASFVREEAERLGIQTGNIVCVNPTRGAAETVYQGLAWARVKSYEPLIIFDLCGVRPGYRFPQEVPRRVDGYLEVFQGGGVGASYVRPAEHPAGHVARAADWDRLSYLCCSGLYYFGSTALYQDAFQRTLATFQPEIGRSEIGIAPLYNPLITDGRTVRYHQIDREEVTFFDSPDAYEAFAAGPPPVEAHGFFGPPWSGLEAVTDLLLWGH
ncbi:MAG TPA: capsular biosynthesis protein [Rhodopila sp.]|nr:capsular biosynthesis protein [Rhodopila sp.]